jgi:uncharacterized membrane protein (DUF4010 family)
VPVDEELLKALSLALGLGLLIGLQRERSRSDIGGIRTYPLIALFGVVCGVLAREWGAFVVAGGLLGVIALIVIANAGKLGRGEDVTGQTSEAAALLTYAVGALVTLQHYAVALVLGGITAVLLHLKKPMHEFAGKLTERDVQAIMRLAILSLIVLPILPNTTVGPYDVLNPREIWLMVVLIVAIGLAGYMTYKFFRGKAGPLVSGVLGGLISSTAATVAYARRAADNRGAAGIAALVIVTAWTMSLARVIVEVLVVAPALAASVVPPLAVLLVATAAACGALWRFGASDSDEMPEQHNPAELKSAFVFAGVYAVVVLATAAMRDFFGDQAVYAVAIVSGVVDVDAITLSTARLGAAGGLEAAIVWKTVMLASLANVVFKAAVVLALGSAALFVRVLPVVGAALATGALLFVLWPG